MFRFGVARGQIHCYVAPIASIWTDLRLDRDERKRELTESTDAVEHRFKLEK